MRKIKTQWDEWHLGSSMTDIDLPVLSMAKNVKTIQLAKAYSILMLLKQIENKKKCK